MSDSCYTEVFITPKNNSKDDAKKIYDAIAEWTKGDNNLKSLLTKSGVVSSPDDIEASNIKCAGKIFATDITNSEVFISMLSDDKPMLEPLYRAIEKHFNINDIDIRYTAVDEANGIYCTNITDIIGNYFVELDDNINQATSDAFADYYTNEHKHGTYQPHDMATHLIDAMEAFDDNEYNLYDLIDEAFRYGIYINTWKKMEITDLF